MKTILALTVVLLSTFAARAADKCEPTIQAQPIHIGCRVDATFYSIIVNTRMSDRSKECPEYRETHTADIEVSDQQGGNAQKFSLGNGEFSFSLEAGGGASFSAPGLSLDLQDCATPMHGGFSMGN